MMHVDVNTKKLKKNAFRVTKHRDIVASRSPHPRRGCNADVLTQVAEMQEIRKRSGTYHYPAGIRD